MAEYKEIAAAAQRCTNANNALDHAYIVCHSPANADALHQEAIDANETLALLLLRDAKETGGHGLISLALEIICDAVRDMR